MPVSADSFDDEQVQVKQFLLANIGAVELTVDELASIGEDLGLAIGFAVAADQAPAGEPSLAARRSLASKQFLHEVDDGWALAPWLEMMVDTVVEPLLVIKARRTSESETYEWSFFLDSLLGVQQQVSQSGLVAWAPFEPGNLLDLLFDAGQLGNRPLETLGESFTIPLSLLRTVDQARGSGDDDGALEILDRAGVGEAVRSAYVTSLRGCAPNSSMFSVLDRTVQPPRLVDLSWIDVGVGGFWRIDIAPDPSTSPMVTVSHCDGSSLAQALAALLPKNDDSPR